MLERSGGVSDVLVFSLEEKIRDYHKNAESVRPEIIKDYGRLINSHQAHKYLDAQVHLEYAAQLHIWAMDTNDALEGDEAGCALENLYARQRINGDTDHRVKIIRWFQELGKSAVTPWVRNQSQKFVELHCGN
jgi:hypothetical protein